MLADKPISAAYANNYDEDGIGGTYRRLRSGDTAYVRGTYTSFPPQIDSEVLIEVREKQSVIRRNGELEMPNPAYYINNPGVGGVADIYDGREIYKFLRSGEMVYVMDECGNIIMSTRDCARDITNIRIVYEHGAKKIYWLKKRTGRPTKRF